MHLVPSQPDSRHIVRGGVCFREHILDFLAGRDVPVRHIGGAHLCLILRSQSLALTHHLHDFESMTLLHTVADQCQHDGVTRPDDVGNGTGSVLYQILRVVRPDIGAVRQSGYLEQVGKRLRAGFLQHLDNEFGTKLRKPQRSQRNTGKIIRRDAKRTGGQEEVINGTVIHGYIHDRGIRILLQVLVLGRHIVSQLVQLKQRIVQVLKGEMRGHDIRIGVIRRVLYRAEIIDLVFLRHDHNAAGMLSRRAADADTAAGQSIDLGAVEADPLPFQVFHDKSVCRLVSQCADGPGTEHVLRTEQLFGVLVYLTLHLTGKIKVDIRRLVAVKSEERLKGDVMPVVIEFCQRGQVASGRSKPEPMSDDTSKLLYWQFGHQ